MTEPDEALIWARERAKADWLECDDETGTLHAAAEDFPSGDSDHFEDIEWRAEAYRAGQAASAERIKALEHIAKAAQQRANDHGEQLLDAYERIKALEGLLRECADDLEDEIQARSANDLPRRIERDMEPVKKARALLKEADQ